MWPIRKQTKTQLPILLYIYISKPSKQLGAMTQNMKKTFSLKLSSMQWATLRREPSLAQHCNTIWPISKDYLLLHNICFFHFIRCLSLNISKKNISNRGPGASDINANARNLCTHHLSKSAASCGPAWKQHVQQWKLNLI